MGSVPLQYWWPTSRWNIAAPFDACCGGGWRSPRLARGSWRRPHLCCPETAFWQRSSLVLRRQALPPWRSGAQKRFCARRSPLGSSGSRTSTLQPHSRDSVASHGHAIGRREALTRDGVAGQMDAVVSAISRSDRVAVGGSTCCRIWREGLPVVSTELTHPGRRCRLNVDDNAIGFRATTGSQRRRRR